jgi:hypothetical protein
MSDERHLDWGVIEGLLPGDWRERAAARKLVKPNLPKCMNTKVTEIGQVLRLVLYQVARNVGQQAATAAFAAAGLLTISHVALHLWMKKLGAYLAELVAAMVSEGHETFAPERWAGYELVGTDASCVQRPGAKGTTARLHCALRLTDLRVLRAEVTDHKGGETFRRFLPKSGQLWIGDRCYANPPGIAWVKGHHAEVLVRYNRGSLPLYDGQDRDLQVLGKLAKLRKPGWSRGWQAFVRTADGERIEGRLCAVRLPADKAHEARARLHREQGAELTAESLAMADFVVVFTTVPSSKLCVSQILELYRLRWQIELEFKRDKSTTGLDQLPNHLPATIESWIYAKLLLHQLLRKVADSGSAIPPSGFADAIGPTVTQQAA